ncbi:frataxin [Schizosaccharomyces japonicus yFS275]|uniref:ferroxidase n=1 Tax=Schizosaccharomyces japonicus (strain yFS275 / FY16936) TaxID=402676 RepID=B6K593_SCHJY|nr:frataxin [Schizosaccharomyces japonicus yFS275]EEB08697.1 frataxin [Schizosaccharomyces japonicus yFS275]
MQALRTKLFGLQTTRNLLLRTQGKALNLRHFSQTSFLQTLTDFQYHRLANDAMDTLNDTLEEFVEAENEPEYDLQYANGVLTLGLGKYGTYVINKQPPNHQIWLSSPISGPKHYDWNERKEAWLSTRNDSEIFDLLSKELGKMSNKTIVFKKSDDY